MSHRTGPVAAESCLTRLLSLPPATHMALGDDPGLATYKARHLLARIFHDKKKHAEAESLRRLVLDEQPDFVQGWLGMGQTQVERKNWVELEKVIKKLESLSGGAVAAAVLCGLRHAVQKDFATARKLMEETIATNPKAIEPRILLSRLCMRDRRNNPSSAERAVRSVLERDPTNAEAAPIRISSRPPGHPGSSTPCGSARGRGPATRCFRRLAGFVSLTQNHRYHSENATMPQQTVSSSAYDIAKHGPRMARRKNDRPNGPGLFEAQERHLVRRIRRQRALFIPRLLREAALDVQLRNAAQDRAYEIVLHWAELETNRHLPRFKETSIDTQFLDQLFGEGLGYQVKTASPDAWQMEHKFFVPGVGTADAALGEFPNSQVPTVVIELKGAKTDLDRDRTSGRTAVQQCWDYLNALPGCSWGIVSNFTPIRLYHHQNGTQSAHAAMVSTFGKTPSAPFSAPNSTRPTSTSAASNAQTPSTCSRLSPTLG